MTAIEPTPRKRAERRAIRIRAGRIHVQEWVTDVTAAAADGDWRELGYESWDAYCDVIIGVRIQLPRADRREFVLTMRQAGMSTRAIGTALGLGQTQVRRDLATEPNGSVPEAVHSLDGRERPATQPPRPAEAKAAEMWRVVEPDGPPAPAPTKTVRVRTLSPEQQAERDRETSDRSASRSLARCVWTLANNARLVNAADNYVEIWRPDEDVYPDPTTAERMRVAAQLLNELADRWPT